MDNNRTAKSVGLVMLLSTLARGLSLVGSILYTSWFGYTLETDIYSYAVNLPNLVFTCLGSALVTVVIPIYAGRLAAGERGRARDFINNILSISLILAAAVALLGIFISPLITGLVGRFDADGARGLALFALRLMFPVMIFHAVNYVLQGVLQSNGRFVLPAIVSAFSGLSVILYVTLLAGRFGIRGLLVATFFGLALQAVVLVPPVAARRGGLGYRFRPSLNLADGDVRLAGRLALPVLVSSSSYQLNMFVNSTFAAGFDGGVITIANMQTLAFTAAQLFILSTLAVYFPKMAALHATGDDGGFRGAFDAVLRLILYFAVPASVGLAFLSGCLIPLLYGHGRVTAENLSVSVAVFAAYAAAIAPIGFKEAADRAFYALKDSATPAVISVLIMAVNIALSFVLKGPLGLFGLPVAYFLGLSTGAAALLILMRRKQRKKMRAVCARSTLKFMAAKCIIASGLMILMLFLADSAFLFFRGGADASPLWLALRLALLTLCGGGVYFAVTFALGVEESRRLARFFTKKAADGPRAADDKKRNRSDVAEQRRPNERGVDAPRAGSPASSGETERRREAEEAKWK